MNCLLASACLTGGSLRMDAEDGGHRAVVPQHAVVEDEMLQVAALDGHHHHAVQRVHRRDHPLRRATRRPSARARTSARTRRSRGRGPRRRCALRALRVVRVVRRDERHAPPPGRRDALPAAVARSLVDRGQEVGGVDGVEHTELARGDHRLAAAPAAVADEVDALADVLAELHEVALVGLLQQVETLGAHRPAGVPVADQRLGRSC